MFNKKGFSLIEILIVIAIIGILAVAFLPSILSAPAKAKDTQRIQDVEKIADFLLSEFLELGTLPCTDSSDAQSGYSWLYPEGSNANTDCGKYINDNLAGFAGVFPKDPDPTACANNGSDTCNNTYGKGHYLLKFHSEASGYLFAVTADTELPENGNMDTYSGTTVGETGTVYTYLIPR